MTASSKIAKLQSNIRYKIFQSSNHSHIWGVLKNGGSSSHHGCLKWPNGLHDVGTLCLKPPCCWRIDCISQSRNSRSPQSKKALLQRSGSKVHWGILGTQSKPVSPKWTTTDQHWPKSRDSYAQGLTHFHLEPTQLLEKSGAIATQINHWTGQWLMESIGVDHLRSGSNMYHWAQNIFWGILLIVTWIHIPYGNIIYIYI